MTGGGGAALLRRPFPYMVRGMSFRVSYSDVIIANRALAMLPEAPIDTFDGPGIARRALRVQYKPTVAALLTKHDFGLATVREAMALQVNDRPEWLFKYAAPNDLAYAIQVYPTQDAPGGVGYYQACATSWRPNSIGSAALAGQSIQTSKMPRLSSPRLA